MVFLTLLANGLDTDPESAMRRTLDVINTGMGDAPIKLTCVFSDGETLFGFRHATTGAAPTLYVSGTLDNGGRALASEQLCGTEGRWSAVPENTLVALRPTSCDMIALAA